VEPAQSIIGKFGGVAAVAAIIGAHRTSVNNWRRPRTAGGTNGLVPQRYHRKLLDEARRAGIALAAEEFLPRESAS
jgi:hypothetical protein